MTRRDLQAQLAIPLAIQIERVSRRAFHDRLADVDFLLSRLPPGRTRDELVARREQLVTDYSDWLMSTVRKSA